MAASVLWASYYPGIATLYARDQGYTLYAPNGAVEAQNVTFTRLVPYLNYPLEYPFFAGLLMLLVNGVGYLIGLSSGPMAALWGVVFLSPPMMGAGAAFVVLVWARARVPAYKALLLFALNPAVLDQFGINFDMAGALMVLLSVYWLARGRRGASALALALGAGVKGFPLIALPLMAWYAGRPQPGDNGPVPGDPRRLRWRYALTALGAFAAGMALQYSLSPANWDRARGFLSGYGIEGSWLGLLWPGSVINYHSFGTWEIGASTALRGLQPFQLASAALLGLSLLAVWRHRARLDPKRATFLLMSAVVMFWWYSPPQFLYYPLALLPLVAWDFKASLALSTAFGLFGNFTLWIRIPTSVLPITNGVWILISAGYQASLALWLAWEFGWLGRLWPRLGRGRFLAAPPAPARAPGAPSPSPSAGARATSGPFHGAERPSREGPNRRA